MNISNYFDLSYTTKDENLDNVYKILEKDTPLPFTGSLMALQWIALFCGILLQPFFAYYRQYGNIDWGEAYSNWFFLLFSFIISIILFPSVYRATFDTDRPKVLQIIPVFTAGLGWETLLETAFKSV